MTTHIPEPHEFSSNQSHPQDEYTLPHIHKKKQESLQVQTTTFSDKDLRGMLELGDLITAMGQKREQDEKKLREKQNSLFEEWKNIQAVKDELKSTQTERDALRTKLAKEEEKGKALNEERKAAVDKNNLLMEKLREETIKFEAFRAELKEERESIIDKLTSEKKRGDILASQLSTVTRAHAFHSMKRLNFAQAISRGLILQAASPLSFSIYEQRSLSANVQSLCALIFETDPRLQDARSITEAAINNDTMALRKHIEILENYGKRKKETQKKSETMIRQVTARLKDTERQLQECLNELERVKGK